MRLLLRDVSRVARRLTREEEAELARRIGRGEAAAARELVEANLPLAVWAARVWRRGRRVEDAFSDAVVGLHQAARKFDPARGKFSTCAKPWMYQAMTKGARDDLLVAPPWWAWEALPRYRKLAESGAEPTPENCRLKRSLFRHMGYADRAARAASGLRPSDGRPAPRPADAAGPDDLRALESGLAELPEGDSAVLRLRFGVGGRGPLTQREAAAELGTTRWQVAAREGRGLARLRELMGVADG